MFTPKITLIFKSGRNQNCPRLSDVSDRKSKSFIVPPKSEHEVWLPVVDVVITPSTKARVGFSNQDDVDGAINGHLYPENFHAREELIIQSNQLIDWENYLYLKQGNVDVNYFWLEQSFPHIPSLSKNFSCEFEFLTQNWYGEIEICMEENQKQTSIGTITIPKPEIVESTINEENILKHENIMHALKGCIQYILNSRVSSVNNPSKGGFYLFYDWDAQTYRNSFWPWGWGPAINALLNASKEEEITETFDKEKLIKTAWEAGRISLKYRIKNPGHETDGLSTTRFDPNATMPNGMRERICTCADGGFLCGWAWMPLFEFTGDEEFLEAGEDYAKKLKEILDVYGLPPQDYATELSKFTEHTLDESGFGTEALAALWNIKKDETIQQLCTRYMDIHTEKFLREDGLWQRQYHRSCDTTEDCVCMTRGLGAGQWKGFWQHIV